MKRSLASVALIFATLFIYNGWFDVDLPRTADRLNNDLDQHALAYEVIDGTPLILASFGGTIFLDTIRLERISMNIPPYPRWQWTGNWELITEPRGLASANLTAEFGPTVLFGLVNDDSITAIHIERDGEVVRQIPVSAPAYILEAEDVLLSDTILFLDAENNIVASIDLM